jgi:hypothetical protein
MKIRLLSLLFIICVSVKLLGQPEGKSFISADNKNISYIGRFDFSDIKKPFFMYSGSTIRTVFKGTSVDLVMDDSHKNWFNVILDDSLFTIKTDREDNIYPLAKKLKNGKHTLEIIRRTEWHGGNSTFLGLYTDNGKKTAKPEKKGRKIEFIGDSYTCGYGIEGKSHDEHFNYATENNYLTYGAISSRELNADYTAICLSGIRMANKATDRQRFAMPDYYDSVAMGSKAKWDYSKDQPQVVAIVLGANDLSRNFDSTIFVNSYLKFLSTIRKNYPATKILCIAGPSNGGDEWIKLQSCVGAVVNQFSKTDRSVFYFAFSSFQMNGSDWHPNVEQHRGMADELIPEIKKIMNW